jgi:hypothetical protein
MIVDAVGGLGAIFLPRYCTFEINEPARHEMCKIESTIINVHGVIQSSYHNTGVRMQGANLTFECILQDLNIYLDESGVKKMRNLYDQLDNVSSNNAEVSSR